MQSFELYVILSSVMKSPMVLLCTAWDLHCLVLTSHSYWHNRGPRIQDHQKQMIVLL